MECGAAVQRLRRRIGGAALFPAIAAGERCPHSRPVEQRRLPHLLLHRRSSLLASVNPPPCVLWAL